MAREVVTTCDGNVVVKIKDCGEVHEDNNCTFTIRCDGKTWEVDLGGPHAEALLEIARRGRELDPGVRRSSSQSNLERRVRNIPSPE